MEYAFFQELYAELNDLQETFRKSLSPWWEELQEYIKPLDYDPTGVLLPPFVLGVYKFTGTNRATAITMANIFKSLYLAHSIHSLIRDDEEGQEYGRELQFRILIGDYLFGMVLKQLVDAGVDGLLEPLTAMITDINSGMVLKHKLKGQELKVLEQTRASFYRTSFSTCAELAGVPDAVKQQYGDMGFNLGMAVELLYHKTLYSHAREYLCNAEKLLKSLAVDQAAGGSVLVRALEELEGYLCDMEQVAVI
jgi:hypothetical protein